MAMAGGPPAVHWPCRRALATPNPGCSLRLDVAVAFGVAAAPKVPSSNEVPLAWALP